MDSAVTALTTTRSWAAASARMIEEGRATDEMSAGEAIYAAVSASGWALLVAPELYLCLCAWWRIQRLEDDLEVARAKRNEASELVSAAKIDPFLYGKDGPFADIAPGRLRGYSAVEDTITRKEEALARAEERYHVAQRAYQRTLEDVTALSPQAMAARLLTRAWREQDVATCRALLEVATKPEDAAGLLSDEARRSRIDELLAKRAGRV